MVDVEELNSIVVAFTENDLFEEALYYDDSRGRSQNVPVQDKKS